MLENPGKIQWSAHNAKPVFIYPLLFYLFPFHVFHEHVKYFTRFMDGRVFILCCFKRNVTPQKKSRRQSAK